MTDTISPGLANLTVLVLLTGLRRPVARAKILVGGIGTMMLSGAARVLSPLKTRTCVVKLRENVPQLSKANA